MYTCFWKSLKKEESVLHDILPSHMQGSYFTRYSTCLYYRGVKSVKCKATVICAVRVEKEIVNSLKKYKIEQKKFLTNHGWSVGNTGIVQIIDQSLSNYPAVAEKKTR